MFKFNPVTGKLDLTRGPETDPVWTSVSHLYAISLTTISLYVSKSGSDVTGDGTAFQPFLTVGKALNYGTVSYQANELDIYIGDGTYNESLVFPTKGAGTIKLIGNTTNRDNVVFTSSGTTSLQDGSPYLVYYDGITFSGGSIQLRLDNKSRAILGGIKFYNWTTFAFALGNQSNATFATGYTQSPYFDGNNRAASALSLSNAARLVFSSKPTFVNVYGGGIVNSNSYLSFSSLGFDFTGRSAGALIGFAARNSSMLLFGAGTFNLAGTSIVSGSLGIQLQQSIASITAGAIWNLSGWAYPLILNGYSYWNEGNSGTWTFTGNTYNVPTVENSALILSPNYLGTGDPDTWNNIEYYSGFPMTYGLDYRYGLLNYANTWTGINSFTTTTNLADARVTLLSVSSTATLNGAISNSAIKTSAEYQANILTDGGFETWNTITELSTDGGFENWNSATELTSWTTYSTSLPAQESTIKKSGNYSTKLVNTVDGEVIIAQLMSGLSTSTYYQASVWARNANDGSTARVILFNEAFDHIYNFTTKVWDTFTGESITSDKYYLLPLTDTFTQYVTPAFLTNSDDKILVVLNSGSTLNDTSYFDDFSFSAVNTLTSWDTYLKSTFKDTGVKNSETSSVRLIGDGSLPPVVEQTTGGLTAGEIYRVSFYTLRNGISSYASLLLFDDEIATATQVYNWTSSTWDAYVGLGGITNDNFYKGTPTTGTFQQVISPDFIVPASGKINVTFGGESEIAYDKQVLVDDVVLQRYIAANTIDIFNFTNASDATKLQSTDTLLSLETTGATDKTFLRLNGLGYFGIGTDSPHATLDIYGGLSLRYRAITSATTITADDYTIDCTSGTFTQPLPTAVGIAGTIYNIKNSGSGTITVDADNAETIDSELTQVIYSSENLQIQSTGSNWIIL